MNEVLTIFQGYILRVVRGLGEAKIDQICSGAARMPEKGHTLQWSTVSAEVDKLISEGYLEFVEKEVGVLQVLTKFYKLTTKGEAYLSVTA
jgi:hypothetical protein